MEKNYYLEMDVAKIGTTFHCRMKDSVINFVKIGQHEWCIRTKYVLNGTKYTELTFSTICTTIEAYQFKKICTENIF